MNLLLNEKLKHLDVKNSMRRDNVELYSSLLKDREYLELPVCESYCNPVWHLFVIKLKNQTISDKYSIYFHLQEEKLFQFQKVLQKWLSLNQFIINWMR